MAANMRDGDWMCPTCNNHNFASRAACNKCNGPKATNGYGGGGGYGAFNGHGGAGCGGYGVVPPALAASMRYSPYAPPPFMGGQQMRPGDWTCRACNNINYQSREECNRCKVPKTAFISPSGMREGDWMCPACNNHNYASKSMCNKCQGPKAGAITQGPPRGQFPMGGGKGGGMREGDWMCSACNNHNFASKQMCNRCQAPKVEAAAPMGAYVEQGAPGGKGRPMREGDWSCPNCNNHNFASRTSCNKCPTPKPM